MSALGPGDNTLAMMQLDQQNMIQKKLDMDSLRQRLAGKPDQKAKLREACEGFESVFIQKMWEQMRSNVQKSGYLHSRDEHMYQGMYDAEFSKKMASAGGIGLADMLYEQLSQRLGESSRTTSTRNSPRLPILPASSSVSALNKSPIAVEEPGKQDGIALDNKQPVRPLYEEVLPGQLSKTASAEPDLAAFDESLAQAKTATVSKAEKNVVPEEMDFESLSQALLAEELAGSEADSAGVTEHTELSEPVLSPEEEAMLNAALRQNMHEAGRITVAQAPSAQFGTAFATNTANPAESAAVFDSKKSPRS